MAKIEPTHEIRLRLICLTPPGGPNLEFGLQDRAQSLASGQPQPDGATLYEITTPISRQGDAVRFHSPYVHGTPKDQFLYLSLRDLSSSPPAWQKRLKIPLATITWPQIKDTPPTLTFEARIQGTGSGTVPMLNGGWQPAT